jgi:diphthamide synthase (EF-2-diphthine--ammonia ligase)
MFPIWEKPIEELIELIESEQVEIRIRSVDSNFDRFINKGALYDRRFVKNLPENIDPMGENGEFHTEVILD